MQQQLILRCEEQIDAIFTALYEGFIQKSILKQSYADNILIVMGEGHLKDKFQKYAAHAGIHAEFTGYMNYSEMCGLLAACDITVNPIRGKSAASIINKHADYAACGLPVINTQNSAEYQKLIEIYHMGYSVKPGDYQMFACKLKELICNEKLREALRKCLDDKNNEAMSLRSLEIIRTYTIEEMVKRQVPVIDSYFKNK